MNILLGENIELFLTGANLMAKKGIDKQTTMIEAFNEANQTGTEVDVKKDDGSIVRTRTRSEAWLMGGHTAIILLEGISGGYMLERVSVVEFVSIAPVSI